jgi:hypothetical protein
MDWPTVDPDLLASLPPVLRAVVRALGYPRAVTWLSQRGGVNVNIPITDRDDGAIGVTVDELQRLREALRPHMDDARRVWLPKPDKLLAMVRNEAIRRTAPQASIRDQALAYNLSSRQIQNIRRDGDDGDGQLLLL